MRHGWLVGAWVWLACGGGELQESAAPPPDVEAPLAPAQPAPALPEPGVALPPASPPEAAPRGASVAPDFGPLQCSLAEYRQDGSLLRWELLGADGLVREHHAFDAEGRETSSYLQQVEEGRVVTRDVFSPGVHEEHHAWHYGERGELLRSDHRRSRWGGISSVLYVYDADGRLAYEDEGSSGKSYLYSEGLLVRIETRDLDSPSILRGLTTFTHHPNGQVKHSESWWDSRMGMGWGAREDFDEAGRLLVREDWFDSDSKRIEQSYDALGRLVQRVTLFSHVHSKEQREETFEYDESGRLLVWRLVREHTRDPGMLDERVTTTRETWRSEYGARGELVLQTVDLDADGVPEGRRVFAYDGEGRLVEERLEGRAPDGVSGRVVYTHGCQG